MPNRWGTPNRADMVNNQAALAAAKASAEKAQAENIARQVAAVRRRQCCN